MLQRRNLALLFFILIATPAAAQENPLAPKPVDHSTPTSVVETLFAVARGADASLLAGLCDPAGENDGDTSRLCELGTEHDGWGEFVEWFEEGVIDGEVQYEDGRATVPIQFGPDGTRSEEMVLIQRDGKWYLLSF